MALIKVKAKSPYELYLGNGGTKQWDDLKPSIQKAWIDSFGVAPHYYKHMPDPVLGLDDVYDHQPNYAPLLKKKSVEQIRFINKPG